MTLKRTALYAEHLALHARMIAFAGWEMPLHYGSQLEEHRAVRQHAGIFDVSHMNIVDIHGRDAQAYLRYLLAHDVAKLTAGRAFYSCMLNPQGGVIDDLITYCLAPDAYRLVLNAARYEADNQWLKEHAKNFAVHVQPQHDYAIIALQGPHAKMLADGIFSGNFSIQLAQLKPFAFLTNHSFMLARTGYTGETGFEIILPNHLAPTYWQRLLDAGAQPAGLGARDSLRLEAGLHLYGHDLDETTTPLESGLEWTISWQPPERQFIGREALLQQKQQGLKRLFTGVVLKEGGILREGQRLWAEQRLIGQITSGGFSPTLQCSIALARVENDARENCTVEIRGKQLPVQRVKPCFVRRGKILLTI